jgi:glycosyltransferase involved in cell wall biosynthesis
MTVRLLYAPNIHHGGGRALLLPLLEALKDAADVIFVLDERMQLPQGLCLSGKVFRVKATLFSRLWCECRLCRLLTSDMLLLCMGNLPPLFASQGIQQVFVQNRYLIDNVSLNSFSLPVRLRLTIERWWLRTRATRVSRFMVQTPTMQKLIKTKLRVNAGILPLAPEFAALELFQDKNKKQYDFIYVASGEPHKNHKTLVKAWGELSKKGIFFSLCLTLDAKRFPDLCSWISDEIAKNSLNIVLIGECSHDDVQKLYRQSSAMVYPSLFESFGLPLIEAAVAGLPVIATDDPYVTDVINPSDVFDPNSPQAIAESVQVFCKKPASLNISLLDANGFLSRVFSRDEMS